MEAGNKERKIRRSRFNSLYVGLLPLGCRLCLKGAKLVVFLTGKCNINCFYCPISLERKGKNVTYANEAPVTVYDDILREAETMSAEGASITGGEPLLYPEKVLNIIALLKDSFGKKFHIHLYTNALKLNDNLLHELESTGLDELRIHVANNVILKKVVRISWKELSTLSVGAEIPAIPEMKGFFVKTIRKLQETGFKFININELEFSDSNKEELMCRGYKVRNGSLYGVEGSEETAIFLLKEIARQRSLSGHYCPSFIKDGVQLRMRLSRRAKKIKKPYETEIEKGVLCKAVIYCKNNLELLKIKKYLLDRYSLKEKLVFLNRDKERIETVYWLIDEFSNDPLLKKYKMGVVEELATYKRIETTFIPYD